MQANNTREPLLRKPGVQTLLASLICILLGLLVGYIALLIINPSGATKGIIGVIKNFWAYSKPEKQLSITHYLMLGMNGETFGGHSPSDVEFSTSYESLSERRSANISRAWERLSGRSLAQNAHFFAVKTFKAYNDGSFASHSSFLELEVPRRADALSRFLRECYHHGGAYVPYFQTAAQGLWLMILMLCAMGCLQLRRRPEIAVLALTLLGVTAYLLLFEVWPRYLFLYAPFFAILASMAAEKSLCSKQ